MFHRSIYYLLGSLALCVPGASNSAGQSLDQAANDPTASLMAVQIQNIYTGSFYNLNNETANSIQLRPVLPFKIGNTKNIARATIPYITSSPSGKSGLGDTVLFDLVAFEHSWGRWGIGPVLLMPTASADELGSEKWATGPALGFVLHESKLLIGLFNQNLFTFAGDDNREDVDVSILQPIVNYSLANKWSIGTSEMNATYDWNRNKWTALPLGVKIAKLHRYGKLPVQFFASYEHNFQHDLVAPKWTINVTAKFLFPI